MASPTTLLQLTLPCSSTASLACLPAASAAPGREDIVREAYRFLQRQGAINFGLLRGDPRVPLPPEVAAAMPPPPGDGASAEGTAGGTAVSDEEVAEKLYDIMAAADMNVRGLPGRAGRGA